MNIKKINEKFKTYKKWFQTLLMKEYFNLPYNKQKDFITIVEDFLLKCKKLNEDAMNIKENTFQIKVTDITPLKTGNYLITGSINEKEINTIFSASECIPKKEDFINCILFSINEKDWYVSKGNLLKDLNDMDKN